MLKVLVVIDYIIFFAVIISSLFWLIDSNFSILLNFVLIYILISVLLIILGFEFLGILLLLLYSTGISIVFIIISMAVGTKHIDNEENDNVIDAYKNVTRAEADAFFVSSNNLTRNILLSVLVLWVFFVLDFFFDSSYTFFQILYIQSIEGIVSTTPITTLNDVFLLGFLLFQQYYIYTIFSGILLLVSLISSICIAE